MPDSLLLKSFKLSSRSACVLSYFQSDERTTTQQRMPQGTNKYKGTKRVVGERRKENFRANRGSSKQFHRDVFQDRLGSVKNFYCSRINKSNASIEQKLSARAEWLTVYFQQAKERVKEFAKEIATTVNVKVKRMLQVVETKYQ